MAATYVSHTVIDFAGVANSSGSVNLASGNSLAFCFCGRQGSETGISATTWNGGSVSPQESTALVAGLGVDGLVAVYTGLSAGNFTFDITLDAAPVYGHGILVQYSGADTADTIDDMDDTNDVASPMQVTSTTDTNALIVSVFYARSSTATLVNLAIQAGNGQTQMVAPTDNANGNCYMSSYSVGAASAQTGFTFTDVTFPSCLMYAVALNGTTGGSTAHIPGYLQMLRSNQ